MACGDTTAFGDLQNYTNDVWLKRGCLHKYTHVPHIPCTKFIPHFISSTKSGGLTLGFMLPPFFLDFALLAV